MSKIDIIKLHDNKIVVKEIEQRDGLTFMRIKQKRLR